MFKQKIKIITKTALFLSILFFFYGCTSSNVSRQTANKIDQTYLCVTRPTQYEVANKYQNANESTKGAVLGGVTDGVIGSISKMGFLAGALPGAIFGGAIGAWLDANSSLVDKLSNRGVKVFVLGDQVMIVLPSYLIFYPFSSNIYYSSYCTLDLVSQLIGNYTNMSIKVAAFTNDSGNCQIDLSLSRQQAERVERYLWKHGVCTRFIYAEGCGGAHLVTNNFKGWESPNFRVEITFEKLPLC